MKWSRPESLPFPQVWWRFKAKDPESGEIVDYRIEDCTEDRFEEVANLMMDCFVPDEPMNISLETLKDEVSLTEIREMWVKTIPQKLTLVCYKEGSNEICALNILEVIEEKEARKYTAESPKGKSVINLLATLNFLKEKANVYKRYNVDKYLHGLGLLTMRKYRGCGLATELLKARFPLMKALGLTLTCTLFSGPGSQGAAIKVGFSEDVVVTYESLGKAHPFVEYPNISWPVAKFMCYQLN
ncbi:uncharacterized protein LOC132261485 [Phlebotomus argentipes]|uniref:uncharacterized protein LOC132261485 n=1 Tax=Phlebotomus argentipes TaxID=94469 RepID=UPI0028929CDB|nr:uncharacterized protein LOC132261485 [Phlebotomus argentipes]